MRRVTSYAVSTAFVVIGAVGLGTAGGCSNDDTQPATHPPAVTPEAGGGGGGPVGDGSPGGCLDDTGDPADCNMDNGCGDTCNGKNDAFKHGVARNIADCLRALPNCDDEPPIVACVEAAVARACPESGLSLYCNPLVAGCAKDAGRDAGKDSGGGDAGDAGDGGDAGDSGTVPPPPKSTTPFNEDNCENIMRALNADGRQNLASCVTGDNVGECVDDPGSCIDDVKR
jgi:hypothetical protein